MRTPTSKEIRIEVIASLSNQAKREFINWLTLSCNECDNVGVTISLLGGPTWEKTNNKAQPIAAHWLHDLTK